MTRSREAFEAIASSTTQKYEMQLRLSTKQMALKWKNVAFAWTTARQNVLIRPRLVSIEATEDNATAHLIVNARHVATSMIAEYMTGSDAMNIPDIDLVNALKDPRSVTRTETAKWDIDLTEDGARWSEEEVEWAEADHRHLQDVNSDVATGARKFAQLS